MPGLLVVEVRVDLGRRGRQAGQVQRNPPQQRGPVGLGREEQSGELEPGEQECVDRIPDQCLVL